MTADPDQVEQKDCDDDVEGDPQLAGIRQPRSGQANDADFDAIQGASTRRYGHLMVGGGVRTLWNLIDYLCLLDEHRGAIEALASKGADFRQSMRLGVVDSQPRRHFGGGYAFTDAHDGTQNTPAEPAITALYQQYLRSHYEELIHDPAYQANPPARQMLGESKSLAAPTAEDFVVARAVLLRKNMNRMDRDYYEELLARVSDWFPELSIERHHDSQALELSFDGPRPAVLVLHGPSGRMQRLEADFVSLHTGPTPRLPVTGPPAELFLQQAMNRHDIGRELARRGLLDDDGRLKAGTRLVAGGVGLSALDVLLALNPFTRLLSTDGDRWVVDKTAAARHQGALTMLSRQLKPAVPRYTYDVELPAGLPALGNTEELLALFVHGDGREVFDAWFTLEQATIAATLGRTPAEVRREPSLENLLGSWHRQTEKVRAIEDEAKQMPPAQRTARLAECRMQDEAIKRAIHLRTLVGLGMEQGEGGSNLADTFERLRTAYPRLAGDRIGHPMHRAHTYAISRQGRQDSSENRSLFQVLEHRMRWVTASPWQVQSMMEELHSAGVLEFKAGSYEDFAVIDSNGRKRLLHHSDSQTAAGFDMGLVQPVFDGRTPFAASFGDRVVSGIDHLPGTEQERRYHPLVGKNNLLTLRDPPASLPVAQFGLSMHGYRSPDGEAHNVLGHDRNDKDSTVADSGGKALRDLSLAVLRSAAVEEPDLVVEKLYAEEAAKIGNYDAEIARLRPAFDSAMAKSCALRVFDRQMAAQAALSPGKPVHLDYGGLSVVGATAADAFAKAVQALATDRAALDSVVDAWRKEPGQPAYRPPESAARYDTRFVDHPPLVHERVRERAFALAAETLGRARASQRHDDPAGRETDVDRR